MSEDDKLILNYLAPTSVKAVLAKLEQGLADGYTLSRSRSGQVGWFDGGGDPVHVADSLAELFRDE